MKSAATLLNAPVSEAAAKIVAEPESAGEAEAEAVGEGDAGGAAPVDTFLLLHPAASIVRQAIVAAAKRIPPRSCIAGPSPSGLGNRFIGICQFLRGRVDGACLLPPDGQDINRWLLCCRLTGQPERFQQ